MSDGTEVGHLDLDTLAAYEEGILDADRSDTVRAHLAACSLCRSRVEELAEVTRLLAETPSPAMPERVTERIDRAIAEDERKRTVVPLARTRRRRSFWLGSAAAAVIALIVIGGVIGGMVGLGGPTPLSGGGSAAGSGPKEDSAAHSARQGGATARSERPSVRPPAAARSGVAITASGRDYSKETLSEQVSTLLKAPQRKPDLRAQRADPTPSRLRQLADPFRLSACVAAISDTSTGELLAVDLASYSGKPSAIIVAASPSSPGIDIWVVDPSCSSVRAHVMLSRTPG